jgi:uncharacterized protein YqjF (DUF2071 family)
MNTALAVSENSAIARKRLLSIRGEPLFYANWDSVVFIHYEADSEILQRYIPFDVDLFDGRAFVSLVAFTMRGMRARIGGRLGHLLFLPIATHRFLNVRTYIRYRSEPAIYFMREWLSNRLSVLLGPLTFGLPYRFGKIDYDHEHDMMRGSVRTQQGHLIYGALPRNDFGICEPESLSEFLLERYTAFTQFRKTKRFFRIWHEPWLQVAANVDIIANDLVVTCGQWWRTAQLIGANYSPGIEVWLGWPHKIERLIS